MNDHSIVAWRILNDSKNELQTKIEDALKKAFDSGYQKGYQDCTSNQKRNK